MPDEQECGAASETAKVLDVGQEGNQQDVDANSRQETPEPAPSDRTSRSGFRNVDEFAFTLTKFRPCGRNPS